MAGLWKLDLGSLGSLYNFASDTTTARTHVTGDDVSVGPAVTARSLSQVELFGFVLMHTECVLTYYYMANLPY
jgi:hypothetical protein